MTPAVEITDTMAGEMMAVSFAVSDTKTSTQLTHAEAEWNIWGDAEEEE